MDTTENLSGESSSIAGDVAAVGSLVDPVRRALYEFACGQSEAVTREEAAVAAGISRTLAAYHLDRLVDAGLLDAGYARPEGRSGPGAGRPAKNYRRAEQELSVTLPARNYVVMADVLATALAVDPGGAVRAAAGRAAENAGHAVGETAGEAHDLSAALLAAGYEPAPTANGDIELRNCPFHQLAAAHTELVCGLNLDLIRGVLQGVGEPGSRAQLSPREGRCCVVIHPALDETVRPAGTP